MPPKRAVFTVTGGRTGTMWLSKFLELNLERAEVHHERLGPGHFGTSTPGLAELCDFNEFGQTKLLREFWKRKFANIELSTADVYVETSHQLAKAGLLENLDLCNCPVTIVLLRRARLRTVASYLKVGAFSECINMWLWFLSPSYKNNIVPFDDYSRHAGGPQFWYYDEIEARQSFYFHTAPHWLKSARNDHVALAHLEDIVNTESSTYQNFFLSTGLWAFKRETIELPPKCNSTDSPGPERFTHNVQSKFPSGEKATQLGSNFSIEKWCNQHNINPLAGRLRVP